MVPQKQNEDEDERVDDHTSASIRTMAGDISSSTLWSWLCRSDGSGCLISVPELADRDVALAMRVLSRSVHGDGWTDAAPIAPPDI